MDNTFSENPSTYEGKLIKDNQNLRRLVKMLLVIINRTGIEIDNGSEVKELLIKTEI
jgi:hypothetical protein